MQIENFIKILNKDFYTGVPDSQLKHLCNYLINTYKSDKKHHIIAANEGNACAIGAGYYLSSGKVPVIYMQNSGEGNIINPLASLLNNKVYAIPSVLIIGWRGEPGVKDEPQHIFQGEITLKLLEIMQVEYFVVSQETTENELKKVMNKFEQILMQGRSCAFVVKKDVFEYSQKIVYKNDFNMIREEAIKHIVNVTGQDIIISTTGKASRELYEIRDQNKQSHKYDFLTVGSMGHSSSIALGIAINKPYKNVWCIDGDGALLMHMGAISVIGNSDLKNFKHIIINNNAHETVGGMPTSISGTCIVKMAEAVGYEYFICVNNYADLDRELKIIKNNKKLSLIEVKCSIGAREDLGRPKTSPIENKHIFMDYLNSTL